MNRKMIKLGFTPLLLSLLIIAKSALAGIGVNIQPAEGGNEIRFSKVSAHVPYTSKAVNVAITSDVNQPYQLVQTLVEPLTNNQGSILPASSLTVYAIRVGNIAGTLNAEHESPVSLDRAVIYTSENRGTSAAFTLVYVLKNSDNIVPGYYQGKLVFTLESSAAAQSAQQFILNITADIESPGTFIDITTASGTKTIVLNSGKAEAPSFDLSVDIRKPLKEQFEISQYLPNLPESTEGKQLSPGALTVRARGYKNGSGTSGSITLAKGDQTLYISNPGGDADHFLITYNLADPEKQNAGIYRTEVQYFLNTQNGQKLLFTFPMEITIGRIFDLIVTPQQPSGIQFQDVQLGQRPRSSEILVEIKSNLGRQYQVSQQLPVQLSSNGGASVPPRYFTLRLEDIGTKGLLKFPQPTEVKTGDMVLFISDKDGSSDKFKIIYEFSADASVPAGNYVGSIVYTISEL